MSFFFSSFILGAITLDERSEELEKQEILKDTVVTVSGKIKDDLSQGQLLSALEGQGYDLELKPIESVQEEPEFTCPPGSIVKNATCGENFEFLLLAQFRSIYIPICFFICSEVSPWNLLQRNDAIL